MSWSYVRVLIGSMLETKQRCWVYSGDGNGFLGELNANEPVVVLDEGRFSERNGYAVRVLTSLGIGFVVGNYLGMYESD